MFKPTDASKLLNIPESSLRRIAKHFEAYLSPHKPGAARRFSTRDLSILQKSRDLLERGYTVALVKQELDNVIELMEPEPATVEPVDDTSPVMRQLALIDNKYTSLLGELELLRAARLEDTQKIARFERWLALPWWRRMFTKPE